MSFVSENELIQRCSADDELIYTHPDDYKEAMGLLETHVAKDCDHETVVPG